MTCYICTTCGTQFSPSPEPPAACPICQDERQYIGAGGQRWTTLETLQESYHNVIKPVEPGLTGIGTHPDLAIGQRALLVQTDTGNVLWDCLTLIDPPTVAALEALGGVAAIAISHPHYYSSMIEYAEAFDARIFLHAADREWVMRPDWRIAFWQGPTLPLAGGLTLIRAGGHFPGATVLHWPGGAGGRGALLTGDIIHVTQDRRFVSFMYSYPNQIPLPPTAVRGIVDAVEPFAFERIYGAWWPKVIRSGAKEAMRKSADRYLAALEGRLPGMAQDE